MCALCGDWIGSCAAVECGARPRLDENGAVRQQYLRHFYLDEVPCVHVLKGHAPNCGVRQGRPCDCPEEDL